MSDFELLFSLFSLLLGLAMAQVLGDGGRVINLRHKIRIGWLTPLLATLVMLDLSSFWTTAFGLRDRVAAHYLVLLLLLVFASAYYLVATLVFPNELDEKTDLDAHYWENRRIVVGAIFTLNLLVFGTDVWQGASIMRWAITATFYACLFLLWAVKSKRANIAMLSATCSLYLLGPLASLALR